MSPFRNPRSLLVFAIYLPSAFVLASPFDDREIDAKGLGRRADSAKVPANNVPCGNAPKIIAGNPVTTADISVDDSPPQATTDPYLPYLWCGNGTSTYVYIDPIGNWGYNKGTNNPVFAAGFDGAHLAMTNQMTSRANNNMNPPTGDGPIPHSSITQSIYVNSGLTMDTDFFSVQFYAQNAKNQKLTYGILAAALTIMKDFVLTYPLYADTSYFSIGDSNWGIVGIGYVGIVFHSFQGPCYLKGNVATNTSVVPCAIPSDYPNQ